MKLLLRQKYIQVEGDRDQYEFKFFKMDVLGWPIEFRLIRKFTEVEVSYAYMIIRFIVEDTFTGHMCLFAIYAEKITDTRDVLHCEGYT